MVTIQVAGEALVDIVDGVAHPGGSPMNVAVGLGRLGHEVLLQTDIGDDEHGRLIAEHVAASGVQLAAGSHTDAQTSSATVVLDESGDANYEFQLNCKLQSMASTQATLFHSGSVAAFQGPSAARIHEAFEASPPGQILSFDPNLRPELVADRAESVKQIEKLAGLADVVKLSDEDALWLYPGWDTNRILEHFLDRGASLAIITFGARGAEARTRQSEVMVPSISVRTVDTVGAGDAFMAGLLHAILDSSLAKSLRDGTELDSVELEKVMQIASVCAGITVSRAGANPPTLDELNHFLSATTR
ncbi:carbohydrate kinase family protein [Glutamicibacter sp.]|uniref:carbohydrate kinase family protein n=1 Tax=Glutamicibacter sp. TaxID=1931995 RepID=UPI003D6BD392